MEMKFFAAACTLTVILNFAVARTTMWKGEPTDFIGLAMGLSFLAITIFLIWKGALA